MNPLCECHGLPMGWQRDLKYRAGGRWECREKRREYNKRRHAQRVEWLRADRAASPRQYLYERRRDLAAQRRQVTEQLSRLSEEAKSLESQP